MKKRTRRGRRASTNYSPLEQRNLLAGDVTAFEISDILFIRGDRGANDIEVVANATGGIEVRGNNTTINGGTNAFVFNPGAAGLEGLRINMGAGDDTVFVEDLNIQGRAVAFGGTGSDNIGFFDVDVSGELMVHGHSGNDSISIDDVFVGGNLVLLSQSGNDTIGIDQSQINGLTIVLSGSGSDNVAIANTTHQRAAYVFTGGGDDLLGADNIVVNDLIAVVAGGGADDLFVRDSDFNGRVFAYGNSSRFDNVEVIGTTTFAVNPFITGFEGNDVVGGIPQTEQVFTDLIIRGARLGTITELANINPQLSTLAGALETTGLDAALQGPGPFTVFAPLNSAFDQIAGTVANLTTNQLADVLRFHVVSGEVFASQLVGLTSVNTLLGQPLSVDVSTGSVILNGNATLAATDIRAKNGVVHVLNNVLVPA
ncbi:MAG: fasciclin domain-containing protein [Planctomycetota bacterium]